VKEDGEVVEDEIDIELKGYIKNFVKINKN
jgi:hypothetical protein